MIGPCGKNGGTTEVTEITEMLARLSTAAKNWATERTPMKRG